jgi:AbrB family looped-hinge helix DNA binding protein
MKNGLTLVKIGKRGTLVIPVEARRRHHLGEDSLVEVESTEEGLLLRPVASVPLEIYSPERKAEFLLGNAVEEADVAWARAEVRKLGLDPADFARPVPPRQRRK